MIGSLGFPEIMLILFIGLLLFGPSKLPELGRSLGKGIREFKKSTSGLMDSLNAEVKSVDQAARAVEPPARTSEFPAQDPAANRAAPVPPPASSQPVKATVIDLEGEGDRT